VGERYDGYAVARPGASADIVALVERVNVERRALYTERSKAQSVPVEAVGKIYALEIIKSAPKGTWFQAEDGSWTQR
ncbi:YdbL family protein, partial [Zavarzinia sp.]|uniref:YdbL family protein n=1 Tax=Zavarzinia sp. TaxID=2027920 RepID=UPI003BB78417